MKGESSNRCSLSSCIKIELTSSKSYAYGFLLLVFDTGRGARPSALLLLLLLLLLIFKSLTDEGVVDKAVVEKSILGSFLSSGLHLASKSMPSCLALTMIDSSIPYSRAVSKACELVQAPSSSL